MTDPNSTRNGRDVAGDSPFRGNPVKLAEHAETNRKAEAQAARLKRWEPYQFTVADLDTIGQPWARELTTRIAAAAAKRDPTKAPPALIFTGKQAAQCGATDAELGALNPLESHQLAALWEEAAAVREACRLRVRDRARVLAAKDAAAEIAIPDRVNLATYVPDAVPWVVDEILARAGVLGLYAERKAGKTTTVIDLARAALDGVPFLGRFPVKLPDGGEVVLFDTEMTVSSLYRQYHRAGVQNLDRLNLRALRGAERSLDARVDAVRARWRDQIAPGSLIIVDCLYSLFGALGVSENSDEVVGVLAGLRTLATECDAAGLVVVHHLGKDAERGARGHSSIEGFPDAIARIELDGPPGTETSRTFSAYGREVAVDPGTLTLGPDHRLVLGGNPHAERIATRQQHDNDAVWNLIERHPGLSVRRLSDLPVESRGKLSRDRIREAVDRLATVNRIVNKGTDTAPEWHALAGVDPYVDLPIDGSDA